MSTCSLQFPSHLSNFLQLSGVTGTVPDWSMSTNKDQISINLVWKTNCTDNVLLVPPRLYRSDNITQASTYMPSPSQKEHPKKWRYTYEIPPRFSTISNKRSNPLSSNASGYFHIAEDNVREKYTDTNRVTTGTSDIPHAIDHTLHVSKNIKTGYISSTVSDDSQAFLDGNMSENSKTTVAELYDKTEIMRHKSMDTLDDFSDTGSASNTPVCDISNECHSSFDDGISGYIEPSAINTASSKNGILLNEHVYHPDKQNDYVHAQLHHDSIIPAESKFSTTTSLNKDIINQSTILETISSDGTNTKREFNMEHVCVTDDISNSSISHSPNRIELPELVATANHNDLQNIISNPLNDKSENSDHAVNSTSGSVEHSVSITHSDNSNTDKPVRYLSEDEDRESLELWISEVTSYLSEFSLYQQFLSDSCTWSVYSKSNPTRGLDDNDNPAALRILHLNLMLQEIGSLVPTIDSRYLNKKSTSLKSIWSMIFLHYQC